MILQISSINNKRIHLSFVQGRLLSNAARVDDIDSDDEYFITSAPIPGGQHFYIRVKTGYKLAGVLFFDRDNHKYLSLNGWLTWRKAMISNELDTNFPIPRDNVTTYASGSACQSTWIPSECYARVIVCREETEWDQTLGPAVNGASLTPSDDFLDCFLLFDNVLLQRDRTYTPTNYKQGLIAALQVNSVYALMRVRPRIYIGSSQTFDDGSIVRGVPYSATPQMEGMLNYGHVGMETYLSAWGNRRSLMYTDFPKGNVSEYGIDWQDESHVRDYGRYVYGMVCTDAAATVLGVAARCHEGLWSNLSSVIYSSAQDMLEDNGSKLRAFDVVAAASQHLFVITDVFVRGNERYFELFESSGNCQLYLVTVQRLYDKTCTYDNRNFKFYRLKPTSFNQLGNPMGRFYNESVPCLSTEFRKRVPRFVPNDDICTFLGNKVTIAAGDMLWLNVRQYNGNTRETFTHLRFKHYDPTSQDYVLVDTVEMTQPAVAHVTTFDNGDEVWDIDVSDRFASRPADLEGPHTGLWQVTAYNPSSGRESEPVEFEVLDFSLLSANCGSNKGMTLVAFDLPSSLRDGRHVYFCPKNSKTGPLWNNYLTYWTDLTPSDGSLILCTLGSTGTAKVRMSVRGTYNYCHKDMMVTEVLDYAHLASVTEEQSKIINASGQVVSGSGTKVYSVAVSSLRGTRLTAVYRDIYSGGNVYAYNAAQYDENGDFIPGTLVTLKPARSPEGSSATKIVSIGTIASNCTTLKFNFNYKELVTLGIFLESDASLPQELLLESVSDNGSIEF